ncbi:MAG: hypothetical protein Q8R83_02440 [Legionellaceae bacterium]|nr:hypothetical protein [Legionellaceae bacterium]
MLRILLSYCTTCLLFAACLPINATTASPNAASAAAQEAPAAQQAAPQSNKTPSGRDVPVIIVD